MQQQSFVFPMREAVQWLAAVLVLAGLAFGFGYFFGRYEQIQLNKSVLKPIPDVNCPTEAHDTAASRHD